MELSIHNFEIGDTPLLLYTYDKILSIKFIEIHEYFRNSYIFFTLTDVLRAPHHRDALLYYLFYFRPKFKNPV